MIHLNLDAHDAEALKHALDSYIEDLRMEIADTDSRDFRETLKGTKATLKKIAEQLASRTEDAAR